MIDEEPGWKTFYKGTDGLLYGLSSGIPYKFDKAGWAYWNTSIGGVFGSGFSFFKVRNEARAYLGTYKRKHVGVDTGTFHIRKVMVTGVNPGSTPIRTIIRRYCDGFKIVPGNHG